MRFKVCAMCIYDPIHGKCIYRNRNAYETVLLKSTNNDKRHKRQVDKTAYPGDAYIHIFKIILLQRSAF